MEVCVVLSLEGQEKLLVTVFLEQFVARTIDAYWQLLCLLGDVVLSVVMSILDLSHLSHIGYSSQTSSDPNLKIFIISPCSNQPVIHLVIFLFCCRIRELL